MLQSISYKRGNIQLIILGILSGSLHFLFIKLLTQVINIIITSDIKYFNKEYIIIFSFIIFSFIWVRKMFSMAIIKRSQKIFWGLRRHIISLALKANYQQLVSTKIKIQSAIVSDINILTQASINIIDFTISTVVAFACLIYLISISWMLFVITLCFTVVGITFYFYRSKKNNESWDRARNLENKFILSFNSILDGFKEIYMEPQKGAFIYNHQINMISNDSYKNNVAALTGFLNNQITGLVLFYILISSVLLYFSVLFDIKGSDTVSFAFILLYLLNSIESVMILLPSLMKAKVANRHLVGLKNELEGAKFNNKISEDYISKSNFEHITIRNLTFGYGTLDQTFDIGPINFTVHKGETIFIYGCNGSGKSTFVHCILGLYTPIKGEIRLNGVLVNNDNYSYYKTSFSVVFSDYYLFNDLLGIEYIDERKWKFYLKLFEIEGKVTIEGRRFSTTNLSTGQRKRLALIAILMEEKPILVMDEWAADQDPYFRKKFYTEIIPLLKNEGFTIIAITHDDKYYYGADKLYKMEYGKLIEENTKRNEANLIS